MALHTKAQLETALSDRSVGKRLRETPHRRKAAFALSRLVGGVFTNTAATAVAIIQGDGILGWDVSYHLKKDTNNRLWFLRFS